MDVNKNIEMFGKDCVVCVNGFMKDFFPEEDVVSARG